MAGRKELKIVKASSVRELASKLVLKAVRREGHEYVELREDGKRHIFFCILCLCPCYSEDNLYDHLNGNLHKKRLAAANLTLLLPNPWPFNDGVFFFHDPSEQDNQLVISNQNKDGFLLSNKNSNHNHGKNSSSSEDNLGHVSSGNGTSLIADIENNNLVIPGVVIRNEISDLEVSFRGFGDISARICEGEGFIKWMRRIWCAWLGKDGKEDLGDIVQDHDFAIITFPYTYDLGRSDINEDSTRPPTNTEIIVEEPRKKRKISDSSSAHKDVERVEGPRKNKRKSFSDPEDMSKSCSNQCGSSWNGSVVSSGSASDKILKREIREQDRAAADRRCDICQQKMLLGKDIATLLNTKTGRLACSSRNATGSFHIFHTSCLIHWILICEFKIWKNQSSNLETTCEPGRESRSKCSETETEDKKRARKLPTSSVFCPECQGTGICTLQLPTVPVPQIFNDKLEAGCNHKAWMKNPEILQNCSTGLCFPSPPEEVIKEKVLPLKLIRFYKAEV